jgi:predicted transcriptional regulator
MEIYIKDKLRRRRVELNLSRDALSKLCGVSSQLIFRAEKTGKIYLESYFKMHDVLVNYKRGEAGSYVAPEKPTWDTIDE